MNKREFLKASSLLSVGSLFSFTSLDNLMKTVNQSSAKQLASDELFWKNIREGYTLNADYINLENGYYCIQPNEILEAYVQHLREINLQGARYMRTAQEENKFRIASLLATAAGCLKEELIITRNTTESLNMIINGFPWQKGDEAVMAQHDYGSMLDMFAQTAKRYGIINKIVSVPLHPKSDEEIVEVYEKAITSKTKLLMVCHMINITGQILPIKKICEMAHRKGVQVMVDGAHAFAHFQFNISELNCDYYGCSLHKWLSSPLGAGFLYVNKKNISKIWPLFAETEKNENDIARLNHTGTLPVHTDLAIANALTYFNKLGADKKESRLRFLQNYWTEKVRDLPNVIINTPKQAQRSCAIANVGIKHIKPIDLAKQFFEKYKIYTVAIDWNGVQGCRITPNLYTSLEELDVLVKAIKELSV